MLRSGVSLIILCGAALAVALVFWAGERERTYGRLHERELAKQSVPGKDVGMQGDKSEVQLQALHLDPGIMVGDRSPASEPPTEPVASNTNDDGTNAGDTNSLQESIKALSDEDLAEQAKIVKESFDLLLEEALEAAEAQGRYEVVAVGDMLEHKFSPGEDKQLVFYRVPAGTREMRRFELMPHEHPTLELLKGELSLLVLEINHRNLLRQ